VDDGGDFFRQELVLAAAARFSADPDVPGATGRAWFIVAVGTIASVLGGFVGYAIGYFLFDAVGRPVLEFYHAMDKYEALKGGFAQWGA
jgi:membrane protein YqaA with SNARE-associated domain